MFDKEKHRQLEENLEQLMSLLKDVSISVDVDHLHNSDGRRLLGTVEDAVIDQDGITLLVSDAVPNWN